MLSDSVGLPDPGMKTLQAVGQGGGSLLARVPTWADGISF